jgi:hypothetical protein
LTAIGKPRPLPERKSRPQSKVSRPGSVASPDESRGPSSPEPDPMTEEKAALVERLRDLEDKIAEKQARRDRLKAELRLLRMGQAECT